MATLGRTGDVEMAVAVAVGELHQRQSEQRAQEERTSPGSPMAAPNSPEEKLEKLVRASFTAETARDLKRFFAESVEISVLFPCSSLQFPLMKQSSNSRRIPFVFLFEAM